MGFAVAASPAAAAEEPGDTAPIQNYGGGGFGEITGPEAPENYPFLVSLGEDQELRQLSETEVGVYSGALRNFTITAEKAHDADGANVPTALRVTTENVVTLTVHYRAGNPAAGGAPFVYPITGGEGWEGGFHTVVVDMDNQTPSPTPVVACEVPSLHDLKLRAAKAKLRAAHCTIGTVYLVPGIGPATGRVVKQFRAAGTAFAAGAPVAVKLGR